MATPTSSSSAPSPAPAASAPAPAPAPAAPDPPPPSSSPAQPLPAAPIFSSQPLLPAAPIFSSQPLLGKPLNPPPPPPPQGFLFHHPVVPPRPAARAPVYQPPAVPASGGYIRNPSPSAVMTFASVTQARPYVYGPTDQMIAPPVHVPIHHVRLPPPAAAAAQQPAAPLVPSRPGVPAAGAGALKSPPLGAQPKVGSLPSSLENKRERDRCREDDVMMIYGRKVRLLDSYTPSLYSLCRSWVRNGQPHEIQSHYGDAEKLLPRPLPASMIESQVTKQHENDAEIEDAKEVEPACSVEELSLDDLLQRHVKHAKSVRARLRKERLRRIERCKQRLALLLPPPSELGRNETAP